jgi:lysozyme
MLSQLLSTLFRKKSPAPSQTQSSKASALSASSLAPSPESSSNNFLTTAVKQIQRHEGLVLNAYQDHLGYWTIGYGRLIDKRKGGGITEGEAAMLLENDIDRKLDSLRDALPWFDNINDQRKAVLLNMAFQMGVSGLLKFKNTLASVEAGDFEDAAARMLKSKWAQQTPVRAKEMAAQMRTGQWQSGTQ